MPTVSVVIPTYGRPAYLAEAIGSVLSQTLDDLEVVVVDDASPKPAQIPEHPRVRRIRVEKNAGSAAARNLGVEASSGEVLAFLDDDDTWTQDRLRYGVEALGRAPIGICWQNPTSGRMLEGDVHDTILDAMTPNIGATVVVREVWVPMDVSYRASQDIGWWLDVTKSAAVATVPRQGLQVRRHTGERTGYGARARADASIRLMDERADYFATHPRAAAFRWKRLGLLYASIGERRAARQAFVRALRLRPSAADLKHLLATVR